MKYYMYILQSVYKKTSYNKKQINGLVEPFLVPPDKVWTINIVKTFDLTNEFFGCNMQSLRGGIKHLGDII